MKEQNNNKGLIALLIAIIIILTVLFVLFATGKINYNDNYSDNNKTNENIIENDTIENNDNINDNNQQGNVDNNESTHNEDFSGIVKVTGYPIVENKVNELGDGKEYSYVYFYIMESNKQEFEAYIQKLNGNAFVSDNAIGIGCIIDNNIKYYNASDKNGEKEYILSNDISNEILNSTKDNPIRLKLERLPLTYGKGAPICYSHITTIEVAK